MTTFSFEENLLGKYNVLYIPRLWIYRKVPSLKERKAQLCQWRNNLREGGDFKLSAAEMFSFDPNPTRTKNAWLSSTCLLYGISLSLVWCCCSCRISWTQYQPIREECFCAVIENVCLQQQKPGGHSKRTPPNISFSGSVQRSMAWQKITGPIRDEYQCANFSLLTRLLKYVGISIKVYRST